MSAYAHPPLLAGRLLKRYKRFFADVELVSGEVVVAHCPNTGPMTGVSTLGAPVMLSHHPDPKRKLAYTWELIQVDGVWVGVNTALPNRLVQFGLEQGWFPELAGFTSFRREVSYERSRVDFALDYPAGRALLEVKNTTWALERCAYFPDTVTTRGQKHLEDLMAIAAQGKRALLLFWIHRSDCSRFRPGDAKDPKYGQLLRQAIAKGVEVLPYRAHVTPEVVNCLGLAELVI